MGRRTVLLPTPAPQALLFTEMGQSILAGEAGLGELLPHHDPGGVVFSTIVHTTYEVTPLHPLRSVSLCPTQCLCGIALPFTAPRSGKGLTLLPPQGVA